MAAGLGGPLFLFLIFGFFVVKSQNISHTSKQFKSWLNETLILCTDIEPKLLSPEEKNYLIWFHKSLREIFSNLKNGELPKALFMKKIIWNNTLEEMAKKSAVECGKTKDANLDESIGQYVIESAGNSSDIKLRNLIQSLKTGLSELTPNIIANYKKPTRGEYDYEHLTQILWWNTKHFGCGRSVYKQDCFNSNCLEPKTVVKLVCNYSPKGNKPGEPIYISERNKELICNYEPENTYCASEPDETKKAPPNNKTLEAKSQKSAVEYRNRSRTIELWPAVGSQANFWHAFDIKFFHLSLTLAILPYSRDILNILKLIFCL